MEINPDTGKVDKLYNSIDTPTEKVNEINWCDTCESTTLKDCLECVDGNKNPNWKPNNKTNTDEVDNTEKHFLETVKKAKTEDLEKVYDIVASELKKRDNTNDTIDKNLKSDTTIPSIKGKLYYQKNNEEPFEVQNELSENDIKEMKKDMEEEINKAFNNMIKNFDMYKYFRF